MLSSNNLARIYWNIQEKFVNYRELKKEFAKVAGFLLRRKVKSGADGVWEVVGVLELVELDRIDDVVVELDVEMLDDDDVLVTWAPCPDFG